MACTVVRLEQESEILICRQLQDCYHWVKFTIEPMAESFPWQQVANGFLGFSSDLLSICKSGANS
jgi:hypothetical protein